MSGVLSEEEILKLKVRELKAEIIARGLKPKGLKKDLQKIWPRPKSMIFMSESSSSVSKRKFSGLRSLCTMPCL